MRREMKGAAEQDAFSGWRKVLIWKPGQRKRIKAGANRRERRIERQRLRRRDDA